MASSILGLHLELQDLFNFHNVFQCIWVIFDMIEVLQCRFLDFEIPADFSGTSSLPSGFFEFLLDLRYEECSGRLVVPLRFYEIFMIL